MTRLFHFTGFLCITALLGLCSSPAQAQKVYFGVGTVRADASSSRTDRAMKKLAFERAKASAAEEAGTYVMSLASVRTVETERKSNETYTEKVATLAAASVEAVEGSKEVQKEEVGEKIVYTAQARYRVKSQLSEEQFEKAVKAYLTSDPNSKLHRRIRVASKARRSMLELDAEELKPEQVQMFLTQVRSTYEQVTAVAMKVEGSTAREKVERQLSQRQEALLQYLEVLKNHGHHHDVLNLSVEDWSVQNRGSRAGVRVKVSVDKRTESAEKVNESCRETRPTWAPGKPFDDPSDRPSEDRWTEKVFNGSMYKWGVDRPIFLYMLDENRRVVSMIKGTKGQMSSPYALLRFSRCSERAFLVRRGWKNEWLFEVPTRTLQDVESLVLAVSKDKDVGYERISRWVWTAPSPSMRVEIEKLVYSRRNLTEFLNRISKRATSM